ncbi:TOTE conflict system archaeo-eukaryotic primase domain-containing protein [Methanolobus halotolerans]|uniref:TOTE conflict system primase domain-containing protein n=1 Tax=Methanolobus halotolerans TaxID=2052935 RepID=A0A4E0PXJ4_9EURY|nr:hypothetical protein [Methanolobus halotolerans]TGC08010.1 hypothetical protein CUN85_10230 [Methanolobus halotolerans]
MSSTTRTSRFQPPLVIPRTNQDKRIATAYNLLNAYQEGPYMVHKTTRAGCTTALIAESLNREERFLVVVPTNKIADKTVTEDSIKYSDRDACNIIRIPSNHACLKNQELCERYPDLRSLPILPLADSCPGCENYYSCPVTRILHEHRTCDGIALTYQKLVALMMAANSRPNTTAEQVLQNISRIHNAVFDEVHEIQYGRSTGIAIYSDARKGNRWLDTAQYMSLMNDFEHIRKVLVAFRMLLDEADVQNAVMQTYNNAADDNYYRHKLSKTLKNCYCDMGGESSTKFIMAVYSDIIKLTIARKEYKLSMPDVLALYRIMNIVTSEQVVIHGTRDRGAIKIMMVAVDRLFTDMLRSFIMSIQNKAKRTLLTSATICSHDYDQYFMGKTRSHDITFGTGGDPMETNSKMLILADSKKYGSIGRNSRYNKKGEILDRISTLLDLYGDDDCTIITLSIAEAMELEKDLEAFGHPHRVTYYKAPEMMGVSSDARVMIAVGVADKPSNSFDAICNTKEESLILREEAMHCDTWQAWSRAKDPAGIVPSLVFALGCSLEQCANVVTWGFGRTIELVQGDDHRRRSVKVRVDRQVITSPKVTQCRDFKTMLELANSHKTFKNDFVKTERMAKHCQNSPINYIIGEIWQKVTIFYNVLKFQLLQGYLINRHDTFAEQGIGGSYFRISAPVTKTLIQNHLKGKVTIGAYSTSENGTCKWICFDIDAHRKNDDTEEDAIQKEIKAEDDLQNLTSFMDRMQLKYLVESSGSPHSYHVWLLIKEVEVEKAYYFANAIAKEAGFDGEVNPKQRTWNRKNQYGNLVKLPFALHRKHNVFSYIHGWEGETMNIGVYDISDIEIPKVRKNRSRSAKPFNIKLKGVRPCILAALEKELSGEQGNKMRVAIVREFYNFGMKDKQQLIDMFRGQADFRYDKAEYHVNKVIEKEYNVWPQQTLLERCPQYLNCESCDRFDCKGVQ